MKLRLHSGTLRLRLSQSEVARLAETGVVEDTISFAPGQTLCYALEAGPAERIGASFAGNRVRVVVPAAAARMWIESDQTGIEGTDSPLRVLVEKDFQCVHPATEGDADAFPNPLRRKA